MSGNPDQKIKLLHLNDILKNETDADHPMTANELCERLHDLGVKAERKSIYKDIEAINAYGTQIKHSVRHGYYSAKSNFELAELRMLMDAVQSANFITTDQTKKLIAKLCSSVSKYQAETLSRQIFIHSTGKPKNREIYHTIEKIHKAISDNNKIKFFYHRIKLMNNIPVSDSGKEFIFSPYSMIWNSDNYYLVGNYDKYDNLSHYRLDRIRNVTILDEPMRHFSEVSSYTDFFDAGNYAQKVFNMYSSNGKPEPIELICENSLLETVIDSHGINIPYRTHGDNFFKVKFKTPVTQGLISWIMGFGSRMTVVSPLSLRDNIKNEIKNTLLNYGNGD